MPENDLPRRLETRDGLPLRLRHWPTSAQPRGTVLIVHGLGEHGGRYAAVARTLNEAGWCVVAHDHRGHGESGGRRGVIAAPDDLLADLARVIDTVRTVRPGRLVLLGHSLGGLVAGRFVAEGVQPAAQRAAWYREVDALVMSSPALDPGLSLFQQALLAVAGTLAPGLAVGNGLSPDWISRDAATVAAYVADPLVHDRIGARLARFIADEGATVIGRAATWPLPTLLMWAGADRCVRPAGSERFATAASVPGSPVSTRAWPALAHEIFNEPERAEVLAALVSWLDRVG